MDLSINKLIRNLSAALLVGSLSICASADRFTNNNPNNFTSQFQSGYSQAKPDTTEEAQKLAIKKKKKKKGPKKKKKKKRKNWDLG